MKSPVKLWVLALALALLAAQQTAAPRSA